MTEPKRVGAIEVEQDLAHERRAWVMERVGWLLLALLVVLALLGLFGKGILSKTSIGGPEQGFEMEYERFVRVMAPVTLRFRLQPPQEPDTPVKLWLEGKYLHGLRIERIEPEPESQELQSDGVLYAFAASTDRPVQVTVRAVMESMGTLSGRVGSGPEGALAFWQFAFP